MISHLITANASLGRPRKKFRTLLLVTGIIAIPTSFILNVTRKLIPPIGGVDVGPVIWIGIISFLREILVGQQGLIKLAMHTNIV